MYLFITDLQIEFFQLFLQGKVKECMLLLRMSHPKFYKQSVYNASTKEKMVNSSFSSGSALSCSS